MIEMLFNRVFPVLLASGLFIFNCLYILSDMLLILCLYKKARKYIQLVDDLRKYIPCIFSAVFPNLYPNKFIFLRLSRNTS